MPMCHQNTNSHSSTFGNCASIGCLVAVQYTYTHMASHVATPSEFVFQLYFNCISIVCPSPAHMIPIGNFLLLPNKRSLEEPIFEVLVSLDEKACPDKVLMDFHNIVDTI